MKYLLYKTGRDIHESKVFLRLAVGIMFSKANLFEEETRFKKRKDVMFAKYPEAGGVLVSFDAPGCGDSSAGPIDSLVPNIYINRRCHNSGSKSNSLLVKPERMCAIPCSMLYRMARAVKRSGRNLPVIQFYC